MPIYDYACEGCGEEFSREQRITEEPVKTCPSCRSRKVKRLISRTSFVLKGSGWYSDLYSSSGGKKDADAGGDTGEAAGGDKADAVGESKSDAKSGGDKADSKGSADKGGTGKGDAGKSGGDGAKTSGKAAKSKGSKPAA